MTTEIEQRACGAAELIETAGYFRKLAEARLAHLSSVRVVLNGIKLHGIVNDVAQRRLSEVADGISLILDHTEAEALGVAPA